MSDSGQTNGRFAIEVEGLECGYDGRVVLESISFAVKRGEIFFVIGGSGCGNSTLLRHMLGLRQPTKGDAKYFGQDLTPAGARPPKQVLHTFRRIYPGAALWH